MTDGVDVTDGTDAGRRVQTDGRTDTSTQELQNKARHVALPNHIIESGDLG